jgi:hypothetical protein
MVVSASPARVAAILAGTLGFALLRPEPCPWSGVQSPQ